MKHLWKWLVVIAACAVLTVFLPHALLWFIGVWPIPSGTSPMYQFWSGFFIVVLSVIGSSWLRRMNCHVDWCWRIGRYPVAGGSYKVCRKHHPDPEVREKHLTHEHILHMHRKHLSARGISE